MLRILLMAFLLLSCGGDDGDSSTSNSSFFSILGVDPYIVNGTFFYDQNDNGIYDNGEPVSSQTDTNGNAAFSTTIPAGGKIIQLTGGVMDGFNYGGKLKGISNGSGGIVLSPLTTLSVNGFTNQQIIRMLESVGINITEDEINQNPMEDPELLRAALTVSQGLTSSPKGYDLIPSDVNFGGNPVTFTSEYGMKFFNQASVVYGALITPTAYTSSVSDLSKIASSFFNYMKNFGADDFVTPEGNPTENIAKAASATVAVISQSENSYQPINLGMIRGEYVAEVIKNHGLEPGNFDLIGFDFINIYTGQVENTLGNYPFSPKQLRVSFFPARVETNSMSVSKQRGQERNWTFNENSSLVNFIGNITQTNGVAPTNVQTVNDLPISTFNEQTSLILRVGFFNQTNPPSIRLSGEGNSIYTFFGIDWGSNPSDPLVWLVNDTRTNNCIYENAPTADCNGPFTYFYNSQKVNARVKSTSALTASSEIGQQMSPGEKIIFTIRDLPLGATSAFPPVDYTLSGINLVEADLIQVSCDNPQGCLSVKIGDQEPRPPLEDTTSISFLEGYSSFPSPYKVYAVNNIALKIGPNVDLVISTTNSSSFLKDNMLVLKLPFSIVGPFTNIEYMFIDTATRIGVLATFEREWVENGVVKFKYRDFNQISLKDIQ